MLRLIKMAVTEKNPNLKPNLPQMVQTCVFQSCSDTCNSNDKFSENEVNYFETNNSVMNLYKSFNNILGENLSNNSDYVVDAIDNEDESNNLHIVQKNEVLDVVPIENSNKIENIDTNNDDANVANVEETINENNDKIQEECKVINLNKQDSTKIKQQKESKPKESKIPKQNKKSPTEKAMSKNKESTNNQAIRPRSLPMSPVKDCSNSPKNNLSNDDTVFYDQVNDDGGGWVPVVKNKKINKKSIHPKPSDCKPDIYKLYQNDTTVDSLNSISTSQKANSSNNGNMSSNSVQNKVKKDKTKKTELTINSTNIQKDNETMTSNGFPLFFSKNIKNGLRCKNYDGSCCSEHSCILFSLKNDKCDCLISSNKYNNRKVIKNDQNNCHISLNPNAPVYIPKKQTQTIDDYLEESVVDQHSEEAIELVSNSTASTNQSSLVPCFDPSGTFFMGYVVLNPNQTNGMSSNGISLNNPNFKSLHKVINNKPVQERLI